VAISAAAGGVGSIAVQLATRAGAAVIGIASPANHEWLAAHGVKPESYGTDRADDSLDLAPYNTIVQKSAKACGAKML
jgi:NADPH:quinone reductase-like Zn-dependent oxidoreductase